MQMEIPLGGSEPQFDLATNLQEWFQIQQIAMIAIDLAILAAEICDGIDNNCNFLVDDDDEEYIDLTTALEYYPDIDEDGYGDENVVGIKSCEQPFGYIGRAESWP